jgi:hypothetical protein
MSKRFSRKSIYVLVVIFTFQGVPNVTYMANASTSESYNFNTANDLTNSFNATISSGSHSQTLTGGIGNSGAINAPGSLNAIFATKNSYSIGSADSTYTFTSFMQSVGNSGYSGMGFSATPTTTTSSPVYRPSDALGISVHGGGFIFHNGVTNYSAAWDSTSGSGVTAVTRSTINDLLNSGSADKWYKVVFKVTVLAGAQFTIRVEVWSAASNGSLLRSSSADAIYEVRSISNSSISSAATIKSYINFSGDRVRYFDDFSIDLGGNASVISAGNPVVVTNAHALTENEVTFNGNVTSENGSPVTERGFVYAATVNPTVTNNKVVVGSGTGAFSQTVTGLASGTYFARAFATNSVGTSYGSSITFTVTGPPVTAPAAPTLNSVTAGDRRVTIAFTAGATNGAAITDYEYSLNGGSYVSAGTTTSPFTITGLNGRTAYLVALKARNSAGLSTASSSLSATTTDASLDASEAATSEASRLAVANAEAARAAAVRQQKELTEILSIIPELGRLSVNIGATSKVLTGQKCVKKKQVRYVFKGERCPKGFVKRR